MFPIYVIGSSNTDMVVKSEKIPAPGETVLGGTFFMTDGGKGANQAVAAARLGGHVTFIANLGNDLFGKQSLAHFKKENIDTDYISLDPQFASGVALINVDRHGENSITVAPGSNAHLTVDRVEKALTALTTPGIVLIQLEIPMPTVVWAIAYGRDQGHRVILNPAPAQPLSSAIYKDLFLITPNESETELLTGTQVTDSTTAAQAADIFHQWGVINVIITLGAKGAYLSTGKSVLLIPSRVVKATDTTGAGDCFSGALAVALSENRTLEEAVAFAGNAASISVTRMGAQSSMPYRRELAD